MEEFLLDFLQVDLVELRKKGIRPKEVTDMFKYDNLKVRYFANFYYAIGYSSGKKIIHVALARAKSDKFDLEVLQVDLPNEEDIKKYWCK